MKTKPRYNKKNAKSAVFFPKRRDISRLAALILCVICAAGLTGCDIGGESSSAPGEIVVSSVVSEGDSAFPVEVRGEELSSSPERVVSLSPAVTEIVAELGFEDRLSGISDYCDFPDGISAVSVGSSENPDLRAISDLKPDVVITLSKLSERDRYTLKEGGIAVVILDAPRSMEDYAAIYRDIAAVFYGRERTGGEKDTEKSAAAANAARSMLESAAKTVSLGSFVYVTEKGTLAGAGTFENAVLSLCGENLCGEEGYVPAADLVEAPEYIIADEALSEEGLRSFPEIAAALDGGAAAVFVSGRCFERPTARTAEIFTRIAEQM